MTTPCIAWVLSPYGVQPCAVAGHQMIEYLYAVTPYTVPLTPAHCTAVIEWRQRFVPLMDLGALVGQSSKGTTLQAAVLAYQTEPGTPVQYVAIAVQAAPVRCAVTDDLACDLPDRQQELWSWLAIACFARDGMPTPILSVAQLCSDAFRSYVESLPIVALAADDAPPPAAPAPGVHDTHLSNVVQEYSPANSGRFDLHITDDDLDSELESAEDMLDKLDDEDFVGEDAVAEEDFAEDDALDDELDDDTSMDLELLDDEEDTEDFLEDTDVLDEDEDFDDEDVNDDDDEAMLPGMDDSEEVEEAEDAANADDLDLDENDEPDTGLMKRLARPRTFLK
jgi:chemotaxis signal transduction protein